VSLLAGLSSSFSVPLKHGANALIKPLYMPIRTIIQRGFHLRYHRFHGRFSAGGRSVFQRHRARALFGLLGYVTVFAIDLIAIQSMFARLEAVRMRDEVGARIYLLGVLVCAGLSAYANGYSSLSGFKEQATGQLPEWMNAVAPWLGIGFPLLILLLSITADYTVDRTSSKLDADKYRMQEQKRIAVLKVRQETQKEMLQIEQDLAKIARERKVLLGARKSEHSSWSIGFFRRIHWI